MGDNALMLSGTFDLDSNHDSVGGRIGGSDRGSKVKVTVKSCASGNGAKK